MEKVRERLDRACAALEQAAVPYAVIGGNAVAAWVATVDDGAVRNTRDVDLLLDEHSLDRATEALEAVGLIDGTWPERFELPLGQRLQELLDDPDG